MLLKKQSDLHSPVCNTDTYFVNSRPFNFENRKRKVFEILAHLPHLLQSSPGCKRGEDSKRGLPVFVFQGKLSEEIGVCIL